MPFWQFQEWARLGAEHWFFSGILLLAVFLRVSQLAFFQTLHRFTAIRSLPSPSPARTPRTAGKPQTAPLGNPSGQNTHY